MCCGCRSGSDFFDMLKISDDAKEILCEIFKRKKVPENENFSSPMDVLSVEEIARHFLMRGFLCFPRKLLVCELSVEVGDFYPYFCKINTFSRFVKIKSIEGSWESKINGRFRSNWSLTVLIFKFKAELLFILRLTRKVEFRIFW